MHDSTWTRSSVQDSVRVNGAHTGTTSADVSVHTLVEQERARLAAELGLHSEQTTTHAHRPHERPFTRADRPFTTILFGGLTWKHEHLIQAIFEGLGYKAEYLPTPDVRAFQLGKEYGNNGQCNPTYFTVGNLVQHLQRLEEQGHSRSEINDSFVFFTAGACGPCRFGMYENEFRLALRNAGFDGFRVLILQQTGGLNQAEVEAGLEMNLDFTLGIVNAMNIGDILNDVAYQIRPFEIEEGATDRALAQCIEIMAEALRDRRHFDLGSTLPLVDRLEKVKNPLDVLGKFGQQLFGREIIEAAERCREVFRSVRVDRTRLRPIVKVTGEFWAQTTEGDGNFNMFRFLEREGAQVLVEPIATWLLYMLHQVKQELEDKKHLDVPRDASPLVALMSQMRSWGGYRRKKAVFTLAEHLFTREYNRLRAALGGMPHELTDQYEMQRLGHPYYNTRVEGGEGHLEVAKNIYYTNRSLCHMVLSVKPFGCMPSTQSDGVQSAVTSHFKDIIYLPIETSGEGEINAHSRVQMALGEARAKAKAELQSVLERHELSIERFRAYVEQHVDLQDPFFKVPEVEGIVGVAARLACHVAGRIRSEGGEVAVA